MVEIVIFINGDFGSLGDSFSYVGEQGDFTFFDVELSDPDGEITIP